jgi:dTDP-4-amino-4,6-dideoxygalactose transaminase
MREDFLVFGAPLISEDEIAEVVATLRSGWIGSGPRVKQFERRFEEYVGVRHAVAVNSCTSALHLHPFYQRQYGYRAGQFPNAEYLSDRTFSVPLSPRVTESDARDVVEALRGLLR